MKKKLTLKNISIFLVFLFLVIQSIRIDKTTEPVNSSTDFIALTSANAEVVNTLKIACYDCHSNQPTYPWYTNIAPVSWWIKHHINEGSHHLNFSIWGTYKDKRKHHKLEECIEMVEEGEMPMSSYTLMHGEAKLTDAQKLQLVGFLKLKNAMPQPEEEQH
ncbi:MAG: heme-binding domain-containing protein [Bacteroidetes bacterium]|nr:heme-binding domain-containing protein [Bacteroidota bacterium]